MKVTRHLLFFLLFVVLLPTLSYSFNPCYSIAATSSEFQLAKSSVTSAFLAVQDADNSGGNVSNLVASLNNALGLIQQAYSENTTSPAKASTDLQSAIQIANLVKSESSQIGEVGSTQKQTLLVESLGSAVAISATAMLLYLFGERLYRKFWFQLYKNYLVKSVDE